MATPSGALKQLSVLLKILHPGWSCDDGYDPITPTTYMVIAEGVSKGTLPPQQKLPNIEDRGGTLAPPIVWGETSVKITQGCSRSIRVYGIFIWVWCVFIWVWSFHSGIMKTGYPNQKKSVYIP